MYAYALREAPMFAGTNTTRFVDKTPAYWEKLELILRRAPGVPVVFVYKTRATAHRSWVQKRHAGEASFRGMWNRFTWQLGLAQRHPRVHTVSFEDLFVHRKGRTRKALFEFLGLKGFSPDFSGRALAAKRGRCHLCYSGETSAAAQRPLCGRRPPPINRYGACPPGKTKLTQNS